MVFQSPQISLICFGNWGILAKVSVGLEGGFSASLFLAEKFWPQIFCFPPPPSFFRKTWQELAGSRAQELARFATQPGHQNFRRMLPDASISPECFSVVKTGIPKKENVLSASLPPGHSVGSELWFWGSKTWHCVMCHGSCHHAISCSLEVNSSAVEAWIEHHAVKPGVLLMLLLISVWDHHKIHLQVSEPLRSCGWVLKTHLWGRVQRLCKLQLIFGLHLENNCFKLHDEYLWTAYIQSCSVAFSVCL